MGQIYGYYDEAQQEQDRLARQAQLNQALQAFSGFIQKNREQKLEEQLTPAKSRYYDATAKGYYAMAGLDPMTGRAFQQTPPTPQQVRGQAPMQSQQGMSVPQTSLPKVPDSFWDDAATGYNSFIQKAGNNPDLKKKVDDRLVSSLKQQFSGIPQWNVIEKAYQNGEIDALTALDAVEALLNRGA